MKKHLTAALTIQRFFRKKNEKKSIFSQNTGNHFRIIKKLNAEKNKKYLQLLNFLKKKKDIYGSSIERYLILISFDTSLQKNNFLEKYLKRPTKQTPLKKRNIKPIRILKIDFEVMMEEHHKDVAKTTI